MFDTLIHADWSAQETKRWMAAAERNGLGWIVYAPKPVPSGPELGKLIQDWTGGGQTVLAGFDFPIGLPAALGKQTGLGNFPTALFAFGSGDWKDFYNVADEPEDISTKRPFYPNTSHKGRRQADMFAPLGVGSMDELRRECERKTPDNRRAAAPLFWTLGANQVGKAAIHGWQQVIRPALARGAKLWPFDGRLDDLAMSPGCVLCETYPREAYGHVGVAFGPGQSKRRRQDRRLAAAPVMSWAKRSRAEFTARAQAELFDGFGPRKLGEDPFDAFIGLLSMIEVVDHRRPEGGTSLGDEAARWEGWILGQR